MLKHRNFVSFFSTILLYIGIGILFFYLPHTYVGTEQKPQEKIISISLSEYEPEPMVEELVEPEPIEEPEPIPEPKEIVKEPEPPVVEEVIPEPEPIVEKAVPKPLPVVKKKKIVKKKIETKKIVKKKKHVKKKTKKRVVKKRTKHKPKKIAKRASKVQASPAKKNAFLAQIRSKISRAKSYPRIAQRRGMQGSVKVRFTILANGQVGNIYVSGPKVFHTSVKKAVKKAFPISVKNVPLSLPTTVNLTLRYQIK